MLTQVHDVSLVDKVCALRDPATYPHPVSQVSAVETHYAWLFLAGEFAYKLKKPLQLDRMNHVSLAARRHSCYAELELNRRLAPQVYLAVVPLLAGASRELFLHGEGEPVEWLVKMHRLSDGQFLDQRIRAQQLDSNEVQRIGKVLAGFYRSRDGESISAETYGKRLRTQVKVNHRELLATDLHLSKDLVNDIVERQLLFLEQQAALIGARADQHRIVEAHGDLRPEHIYLGELICVIDCLEFDRDLRLLDPLEELAFLSVECELLDAVWIGREIVKLYCEQAHDTWSDPLFNFYCSHRAATRAKLVAWHVRDPLYRGVDDWPSRATRYLQLARSYFSGFCQEATSCIGRIM